MIYLQLLWVYLKIGMFGFGGGYAMLSLIQHEIVVYSSLADSPTVYGCGGDFANDSGADWYQ